ncbi:MAG TPA: FAD-binding protein [Acidimicrobiia bacterium]|nr:FAD-binding protein [Acidimicrobiia bacterium]
MRIAALVKQIPAFEEMELGPDGRLRRAGLDLEMNPYCRRAVSQACELAAAVGDGTVTVLTLGPPTAEDTLREAIAWATEQDVTAEGVLITDPAFAGSDTLATARALAAAIEREGGFDLVLTGRNSVDADTGQVGPGLAELLGLPFATGARYLSLQGKTVHVRCEHDDGFAQVEVTLPAVVSCAERLIDPCKVDALGRASVPVELLRTVSAADLGPGPWGEPASPTRVGTVRVHAVDRARTVLEGPVMEQVRRAVDLLREREALTPAGRADRSETVPPLQGERGDAVAVVVEPDRDRVTRELLGAAARLAVGIDGHAVALCVEPPDPALLASWGADAAVFLDGSAVEEDIAAGVAEWSRLAAPWAVLATSTAWGREVAARAAARLGAGLTGDAVDLEVGGDGRLVAWKPAFGGQLVAAITATSPVQLATVRAGVLVLLRPRSATTIETRSMVVPRRTRLEVRNRTRDDDLDALAEAETVVGVGAGVDPAEYPALEPLRETLGAELAATRKVTDKAWLPRARQVGLTGRTIAPHLYVAVGLSGKFNHMVGVRAAGTILAVNAAPDALVFGVCDIGIVADWHEVVPVLVDELVSAGVTAGS